MKKIILMALIIVLTDLHAAARKSDFVVVIPEQPTPSDEIKIGLFSYFFKSCVADIPKTNHQNLRHYAQITHNQVDLTILGDSVPVFSVLPAQCTNPPQGQPDVFLQFGCPAKWAI